MAGLVTISDIHRELSMELRFLREEMDSEARDSIAKKYKENLSEIYNQILEALKSDSLKGGVLNWNPRNLDDLKAIKLAEHLDKSKLSKKLDLLRQRQDVCKGSFDRNLESKRKEFDKLDKKKVELAIKNIQDEILSTDLENLKTAHKIQELTQELKKKTPKVNVSNFLLSIPKRILNRKKVKELKAELEYQNEHLRSFAYKKGLLNQRLVKILKSSDIKDTQDNFKKKEELLGEIISLEQHDIETRKINYLFRRAQEDRSISIILDQVINLREKGSEKEAKILLDRARGIAREFEDSKDKDRDLALCDSLSKITLFRRDSISSITTSVSSNASGISNISSVYGERIGKKVGGANVSADLESGIYKGDHGTFLVKSDDKAPGKDIAEFLTAKVYESLSPDYGCRIELVHGDDGKVFLASKFIDGYRDFYKVMGDDDRRAGAELVSSKIGSNRVHDELLKAMPGGEYVGYPESMIPSMIAGDFARHSGNFGVVTTKSPDGREVSRLVCIDFGAAARAKHFSGEIDLRQDLPDKAGVGQKNYYRRDHPKELLDSREFAAEADRMAKVDMAAGLRVAWLEVVANFPGDTIKAFGEHIGVSTEDLALEGFQNIIRDRYIETICTRQQSMKNQYGTQARERKITPEARRLQDDLAEDRAIKTNIKREIRHMIERYDIALTQENDNIKRIVGAEFNAKTFDIAMASIKEIGSDQERSGKLLTEDQKLHLIKIKNRLLIAYMKQLPEQAKEELIDKLSNLPGDVNNTEIKYIKEQLPDLIDKIDQKILKNSDRRLNEKDRALEEGAYKLYSEGYTGIKLKSEGATPGFMCKTPEGVMCIVKTGPKGAREELESIAELFACDLGAKVLDESMVPKVELVNLSQQGQDFQSTKGYVKSEFFPGFRELFHEMGCKERPRTLIDPPAGVNKFIDKLIASPEGSEDKKKYKDFCRQLAFRHIVRDLDGHSANFGISVENGKERIVMIDLGLAGKGLSGHPMIESDLKDKRVLKGKAQGEASPNHLADWEKIYETPEFLEAATEIKGKFESPEIKSSMKASLEATRNTFNEDSLKRYCTKWLGIQDIPIKDGQIDIDGAVNKIFETHKTRAKKLDELAQGRQKKKSFSKAIGGQGRSFAITEEKKKRDGVRSMQVGS